MQYRGIIIKESLENPAILESLKLVSKKSSEDGSWQLCQVEVDEEHFDAIQKALKPGTWYTHFWDKEGEIVALFKEKIFKFNSNDKASWIPVLKYGQFLGIPHEQLDFPTDLDIPVYIFIDASNLWAALKVKARFIDFNKLTNFLKKKFETNKLQVFYYTAYPAEGTRSYSLAPKHKFFVFLKKSLGFEVRKKELKRIAVSVEEGESTIEKGNMDVEMTIDAIHHASKYDRAVFFTGDSDFLALVTYLRNKGKKIYIFSSKNNISQELRTGADGYTDILGIEDDIWGNSLGHRAQKDKSGA